MIKAAAGDELYMGANNTYAIRILNNGTNNVVLDNGSNLGIGIAAPDTMLTINTGAAADGIKYEVSYSPVNSLPRGVMTWDDGNASGNVTGQIDTRFDGTTVDLHIGSLYSGGYNSLSRLVVKGNGNVSITDGNLAFANGHGIDFSATTTDASGMTSETLSDYEIGTWTPVMTREGASSNASISVSGNAEYVKVGAMVTVTFYADSINFSGVTNGTLAKITGFPFTADNWYSGTIGYGTATVGSSTIWVLNGSNGYFLNNNGNGFLSGQPNINRGMFTMSYKTDQ